MIQSLYRDNIIIIKKSTGEQFKDIKASVQNGKKAFYSTDAFVEPGDILIRKRGEHSEEYIILEPNFYEEFHGIKAHYQSDIIRKDKQFSNQKTQHTTNHIQYNLTGNSRINNNSIDNSLNATNDSSIESVIKAIEEARLEIASNSLSKNEQQCTEQLLDVIETQVQSDSNYKTLAKGILTALPVAVQTLPSIVKLIEIFSK